MQVENSTFLISGGGSGLGAACARRLAGAGANVVIADINPAAGGGTCETLYKDDKPRLDDCIDHRNIAAAFADVVQNANAQVLGRGGR